MRGILSGLCLFAGIGIVFAGGTKPNPEFQYDSSKRKCVNAEGQAGYNDGFVGQCGGLKGVQLAHVRLNGRDFRGAYLVLADFRKANLEGADLESAISKGALFDQADLTNSSLIGCNLRGAGFRSATLAGADLRFTNLRFANLRNVNLKQAQMMGADLSLAQLHGADLTGADLMGAVLTMARYNKHTTLPFSSDVAEKKGMVYEGP